ncbi:hypothetical protein [Paenibacillus sp.]|uniref:hypothetical protein n=1 Tax=Paenibacillus sp. TaxID=58172 RepID=UPI002D25D103|nr:hypothetical protein [Paenibacillus sp.]HZG54884.1 hypothetical protein [Paenibacillus sp.]
MNPEVRKFVQAFEAKMKKAGRDVRLNENEIRFLQEVFGPEFSFNFQGLTAQMPFTDYSGKGRYIDFVYESPPIRIMIEIDSLHFHVTGITAQQYDDHLERQNDMIISGRWIVIRFTANMIRRRPMVCRRQLVQAVGKCLISAQHDQIMTEAQLWRKRETEILLLAAETQLLKPLTVAVRFGVTPKTARKWLQKLAAEKALVPVRNKKLIVGYSLPANENTAIAQRTTAAGRGSA